MRALNERKLGIRLLGFSLAALLAAAPGLAEAQDNPAAPATPAAEAAAPQAPASQTSFSWAELEKLLAPIALYPDSVLAQMLPASAYPIQIVQAHRWLDANAQAVANNDYSGIDNTKWDPAVKALARFPDVLKKMSEDLNWTTDLGDAFVNQPKDVADVIQELRARAETTGALKTTPQQTVTSSVQDGQNVISIASTDPSMVYVPFYDPVAVYQPHTGIAPLLTFGAAVAVGAIWANNFWNWGTGWVRPPIWPGYGAWRAPYAGWRPGTPVVGGGNVINTGNINTGNINAGNRWKPGGDYRPGLGSKPGIGNRPGGVGGRGRPGGIGGVGGPGGVGGVGGAGRPGGIGGAGKPGGVGGPGRPGGVGGVGGAGRPGGVGGPGKPGGVGGPGRPGGVGGVGSRPGAGNRPSAGARPGGGRPGGARPATRPAARPGNAGRPSARPGGFAGGARAGGFGGARPGGFHGGGHRGGMHRGGGGGHRRVGGGGRRSDMRLKHDIVLIGRLDDGLGYYRFVYNGGHTAYVGVMAQEVQTVAPAAVTWGADGYMRVSYELLGLPFETYQQWVASGAHLPSVKPGAQ